MERLEQETELGCWYERDDSLSGQPYWVLWAEDVFLVLEQRPGYCNRGRFHVNWFRTPGSSIERFWVSDSDPFPRYYFSRPVAEAEMSQWLRAHGQLQGADAQPTQP